MAQKYIAGGYVMTIRDEEGKEFTFNNIELTAKQAREAFTSIWFHGCKILSIKMTEEMRVRLGLSAFN